MQWFKSVIRLTAILSGLLLTLPGLSQQIQGTVQNSATFLPADTLIQQFERLHGIRFYYQADWFKGKNLAVTNLKRSPDDFLYLITQTGECAPVIVDSVTIVLVPPEFTPVSLNRGDGGSVVQVGKMRDYGKYKRAVMSGIVVDGKTGVPLPGVSISVMRLNLGTTTDRSGKYTIEMPVGDYEIQLSYIGFEPAFRSIRLVSNGTADFEMFDKSVLIQEVVISLERADFNLSRTQMSQVKLDSRAIRELPVSMGELDILKSVALLPGIQSSGEFGTGLFVRGGSADQNLILIEEVPVFNASHLFGLTSIVNPDGIASVTMLKAGIPARYGERSSSVMDIRLGANNQDNVKVKGGIGLINSRISLNLPVSKKVNLYLGGRSSYSNWLLHSMPDVDLMNSSAGFYDLNGLFSYTLNSNNKINLFGYVSNDKFSIKKSMDYDYGNILGSFRWNHIFGEKLSSVLVAGFSRYDYSNSELDTMRKGTAYKINADLIYKNLKYNLTWIPWRNHSFDMGVNGIFYTVKPGKLTPYDSVSLIIPLRLQTEHALEYAMYAGDNITLSPKMSAEVGLRYSGYEFLGPATVYKYDSGRPKSEDSILDTLRYGKNKPIHRYSNLEPRVSVRFSLNNLNSLKISYNRINQYINLVSNTMVMNPADIWKLSNSYVRPLVCDQVAFGYFRNFMKNTWETSLEVYYKKLNHIIEYKNGATLMLNPLLEADLLDASGHNFGAEMYIKKNAGRLTGWLSYAWSTAQRHTSGTVREEQVNGNNYYPSTYDQPNSLNMVGNYHISRRWRFSWTFTYSTGRPITLPELTYFVGNNQLIYYSDRNKYRLPDYHRLDIAITCDETLRIKKFWKGSWTFSVVNLYGRKNKYSVYYQKDAPYESARLKPNSLYSLYIIGRPLPTLTYNFTF